MYLINFSMRILAVLLLINLTSCGTGFFKPDWSKTAEPNAMKRARQNVEEGRGMSGGGLFGKNKGSTNFVFASLKPKHKTASLDKKLLFTVYTSHLKILEAQVVPHFWRIRMKIMSEKLLKLQA